MAENDNSEAPDIGKCAGVIFALVAHRLSNYYEYGHWMTQAQAATLCNDWLLRARLGMSLKARKCLADLSDQVAGQIRDTLSREAGLFITHELMESLDPRYISETTPAIMDECVRVLKDALQAGEFPA